MISQTTGRTFANIASEIPIVNQKATNTTQKGLSACGFFRLHPASTWPAGGCHSVVDPLGVDGDITGALIEGQL